jgi:hypothetical protein
MFEPRDFEIATFFLLVLGFEIWERLRPARKVDKLADLRIDLLSFALAVLMNRLSRGAVDAVIDTISPGFVLSGLDYLRSLPSAVKIAFALLLVDFTIY